MLNKFVSVGVSLFVTMIYIFLVGMIVEYINYKNCELKYLYEFLLTNSITILVVFVGSLRWSYNKIK